MASIQPSAIIPGFLYLGCQHTATNRRSLVTTEGVLLRSIVNMTPAAQVVNKFEPQPGDDSDSDDDDDDDDILCFEYMRGALEDRPGEDISRYFDSTFAFIDGARQRGRGVLVHCQRGVSRSATIVCAYLMRAARITTAQALAYVTERRSMVCPNPGFVEQLKRYETQLLGSTDSVHGCDGTDGTLVPREGPAHVSVGYLSQLLRLPPSDTRAPEAEAHARDKVRSVSAAVLLGSKSTASKKKCHTSAFTTSLRMALLNAHASDAATKGKDPHINQIHDGLFLGDATAAMDDATLAAHGITHVVNATTDVPIKPYSKRKHHRIAVHDRVGEDLAQHVDAACAFIDHARADSGRVLVHCMMGKSRSASIVITWLMRVHRLPLLAAFQHVKERRPIAFPNIGFLEALGREDAVIQSSSGVGQSQLQLWPTLSGPVVGGVSGGDDTLCRKRRGGDSNAKDSSWRGLAAALVFAMKRLCFDGTYKRIILESVARRLERRPLTPNESRQVLAVLEKGLSVGQLQSLLTVVKLCELP